MKTVWLLAFCALVAACSPKLTSKPIATLETTVNGRALQIDGLLTVPNVFGVAAELRITNTNEGALEIESLRIESSPPDAFRLAADFEGQDPLSMGPFTLAGDERLVIYLVRDPSAEEDPTAVVRITSNSVNDGVKHELITYDVELADGSPALDVLPDRLDFDIVGLAAGTKTLPLQLVNQGNAPLVIDGFTLSGHANYTVTFPGMAPFPVGEDTVAGIVFDEPLVIEPLGQLSVSVSFFASDPDPARALLLLQSNDPLAPAGTSVPLEANIGAPCIDVDPTHLEFGGRLVGRVVEREVTITSCGEKPLRVTDITLTGSDEFTLVVDDPSLELATNQSATFTVQYTPAEESPIVDSVPTLDTATITIATPDALVPTTEVPVSGFGVLVECPTPVIVIEGVEDGGEVTPQTVLHLFGSESYSATGTIGSYKWSVAQPVGSVSTFQASATLENPKFEVNVAGEYVFKLEVVDSDGVPSCVPAFTTVFVVPSNALHIELLWTTPNDDDETNTGPVAGSDLDLHFAHAFATASDIDDDGVPDGWFDDHWDVFWMNKHPNWADFNPTVQDDPALDRDDTDGGGPENLNLDSPENGKCYRVGVHYWDDHQFGSAQAIVRVYLYSTLVFETTPQQLFMRDMWEVTTICWPLVDALEQGTKIVHDYRPVGIPTP